MKGKGKAKTGSDGSNKNAFSSTLLLPNTDFPIRADAPKREHLFRGRTTTDLYRWQWSRFKQPDTEPERPFMLHDGPPYANGHLHMGHALNKILKDFINRYQVLRGRGVHYAPGWDCHGLPIELKALSELESDINLEALEIRQLARRKALEAIEVQKGEFKEFGIMADWDDPRRTYRTLDVDYEIRQLKIFGEMAKKGLIYRARRPVYWSPSTRTALAEAELEYIEDYLSHSVYVRLPLASFSDDLRASLEATREQGNGNDLTRKALEGTIAIDLVVWTTTPWSLPSNMAVAVHPDLEYSLVALERQPHEEYTLPRLLIVGTDRIEAISKVQAGPYTPVPRRNQQPQLTTGVIVPDDASEESQRMPVAEAVGPQLVGPLKELARFRGSVLLGSSYVPPLQRTDREIGLRASSTSRPVIGADYVTAETGTGLVHTAPAHGAEDYECMKGLGLLDREQPFSPIDDSGCFTDDLSLLGFTLVAPDVTSTEGAASVPGSAISAAQLVGQEALGQGGRTIVSLLHKSGLLLSEAPQRHRYPCDWRSKHPIIIRATWQWFADLSRIKSHALKALEHVHFTPTTSRTRLQSFVQGRSEWCISRQRAWGVPIPVLYDEACGQPLLTVDNIEHIVGVLKEKGMDYWWTGEADEFVAPQYAREKSGKCWIKGTDTIDVWFDSGSSWAVMEDYLHEEGVVQHTNRAGYPVADVYLEGSDQHRGWFQSSLLTRISTGRASSEENSQWSAPYKHIVTHGMVVDKEGKKMSKSIGNTISPLEFIRGNAKRQIPAYGTDVLRLWVARSDYTKEAPVGNEIVKKAADALRKLRNTARFMLANLKTERVKPLANVKLDFCELYTLHQLALLEQACLQAYDAFDFATVARKLNEFVSASLSTFYLDITKDVLYSDARDSPRRQAVLATLDQVLRTLTAILAPITPHLAEEIHQYRQSDSEAHECDTFVSAFEAGWQPVPLNFLSSEVAAEGAALMGLRQKVLLLVEQGRQQSFLKSALEADVHIRATSAMDAMLMGAVEKHESDLARFLNVSRLLHRDSLDISASQWQVTGEHMGLSITISAPQQAKCPRCWLFTRSEGTELCARCDSVVHAH
ncbi:isoleucyl-tRNA synthetase [Tilletiaria anomala UBC 951]|uniref:isoleucine--tRNA ligase n=1 Tax=Tilletiaria anomala (strain ATCC 24038 / CBS 436.72 / UBC 951) TaxID=1037660 RepID=A0A066VIM7_TILAU|nr:isoleucyl-tRNA synthetase [Tilletiaria anomala UBC 951]KDN40163.1 isoleucyl-tRNA synthetase [Tilletiaria anomala UBC 951]